MQGRRAARAVGAVGVAAGVILFRPGTTANRVAREQIDRAARRLRDVSGQLRGVGYRLGGRRPDPDVSDLVLADRIRSSLGPLEKRLDIPRVHVMVENHIALLHGVVSTDADVDALEREVAGVSGVVGVESYLHVGLNDGDSRPSSGRAVTPPSEARRRLINAAIEVGIDPGHATAAVRAVLATFADRLPVAERGRLAAHLPVDVRVLFTPPHRTPPHPQPRTAQQLVAGIVAADVRAVLPPELRQLWNGSVAPVQRVVHHPASD